MFHNYALDKRHDVLQLGLQGVDLCSHREFGCLALVARLLRESEAVPQDAADLVGVGLGMGRQQSDLRARCGRDRLNARGELSGGDRAVQDSHRVAG